MIFRAAVAARSLLLILLAVSIGCSSKPGDNAGDAGDENKTTYRIAVIPKGTSHEFWKSVHYGALLAARDAEREFDDIKIEILWDGPVSEKETEKQIEVVEGFIVNGVDGICLAPNNDTSLVKPVATAAEQGIPVAIFDSGLSGNPDNYISYVATDNRNGGQLAAREMAKQLDGEGEVIVLRYLQGSESTTEREEGFLETMREEFPEITVISSDVYIGTTEQDSLANASQVLRKFQDEVDGVFAVCEPNARGVQQAIIELEMNDIVFVAFDASDELTNGMTATEGTNAGSVDAIVLQDPVTMGYETVSAMVRHLRGEDVKKRIATGEHVATRENYRDEKIDALLSPKKAD